MEAKLHRKPYLVLVKISWACTVFPFFSNRVYRLKETLLLSTPSIVIARSYYFQISFWLSFLQKRLSCYSKKQQIKFSKTLKYTTAKSVHFNKPNLLFTLRITKIRGLANKGKFCGPYRLQQDSDVVTQCRSMRRMALRIGILIANCLLKFYSSHQNSPMVEH